VPAPESADFSFHAALLVGAFLARLAKKRVEAGGPWVHEF
jgi:hypothetical protein